VTLRNCSNLPSTWTFQDDGTVFSNVNRGCLSVVGQLDEAAEVGTGPCPDAFTWNRIDTK
jgi:hypothetical protein